MKHRTSIQRNGVPTHLGGRPTSRRLARRAALGLLLCLTPAVAAAQSVTEDGLRLGVGVAGTGFISFLVEYRWGNTSLDMALSTITFRDVGVYAGMRQYLGSLSPQPVVGLGLWGLVGASEQRTGGAVILRAPIGIDWNVSGNHFLGFNIALNKALAVRRSDPMDTEPPNPRLVPLPALEYRFRSN